MKDLTKDICEMEDILKSAVKTELFAGIQNANTDELSKAINMIHHLAETKKNCLEAKYYETVIDAMEGTDEERYGYNSNRYASGRYAPKGYGNRSGYKPYMDQEPYVDDYINGRMGYKPTNLNKYGWAYNNYQDAKMHYTSSHSEKDKSHMNMYANEHLMDTIETLKEIYKSADPDLKKRMRTDLSTLINEMPT